MFRRIRYRCPQSGEAFEFMTNHMKISPGVVAWLYKRRWDMSRL